MIFMPLDIYRAEGTRGTQVFTGTASYASFSVDRRYLDSVSRFHHRDGPSWTVACAVATLYSVGKGYAVVFYPYCVSDLNGRLIQSVDRTYSPCGAYVRTFRAFRSAIAALLRRFRLHEVLHVCLGTEHFVGAYRNTKLASSAVLVKISEAYGSRWYYVSLSIRLFLIHDGG